MSIESTRLHVGEDQATAGSNLRITGQVIKDGLDKLSNELAPLESTWVGQASIEYQNLRLEWSTAANNLFAPGGILDSISFALDTCRDNYEEAEMANTLTWRNR